MADSYVVYGCLDALTQQKFIIPLIGEEEDKSAPTLIPLIKSTFYLG